MALGSPAFITADWTPGNAIQALVSTRTGGVSAPPYGDASGARNGFNLGAGCGDDVDAVEENRRRLQASIPAQMFWLEQIHGNQVVTVTPSDVWPAVPATVGPPPEPTAESPRHGRATVPRADASVTQHSGIALAILSADCLPVLFAAGDVIGAAHAGWRGLANGVLEAVVVAMEALGADRRQTKVWLGPAIGPRAFEVGADVLRAFSVRGRSSDRRFEPGRPGKWSADIYGLARDELNALGIEDVAGGGLCTVTDSDLFYSYRRDGVTGRMASVIWRDDR